MDIMKMIRACLPSDMDRSTRRLPPAVTAHDVERDKRLSAVTPLNVVLSVLALLQARFFTVFLHSSHAGAHVEAIAWDYDIPFVPWMIFAYMSVYVLLALTVAALVWRGDPWRLTTFLLAFVFLWGIADFIWSAYPTVNVIRPTLGHSFLDRLVDLNYGPGRDTLPSGHNMTAWLCAFMFLVEKTPRRGVVLLWAALISASTLLVRQHYIVDVVVSVPLAFVVLYVVDHALTHQLQTS
jgi:membrane-associated phospholipid phosphatase